jgi:chorismate dehydratase
VGDKAVADPPAGFEGRYDLGTMWHEMTGLPFVFAIWAAVEGADCETLYSILQDARLGGQEHAGEIARRYAPACGWPESLAEEYLTGILQFEFTPAHQEGLEEFLERAEEWDLIRDYLPLRYYAP